MDIILIFWLLLVGVMSAMTFFPKLPLRQAENRRAVPVLVSIRRHGSSRGV
jgi:hypothetical protein